MQFFETMQFSLRGGSAVDHFKEVRGDFSLDYDIGLFSDESDSPGHPGLLPASSVHARSRPLHLLELPVSCLERILAFAVRGPALEGSARLLSEGAEDGLPLVCKLFREAYVSAPVFRNAFFKAERFRPGQANLAAFLRALQRRGKFFQDLTVQGDAACDILGATPLDVISAAHHGLTRLKLTNVVQSSVCSALLRFGALTSLVLEGCTLDGSFEARCGALTALQSLWLEDEEPTEFQPPIEGLSHLTALTHLYIRAGNDLHFPPLDALRRLHTLHLDMLYSEGDPYVISIDLAPVTSLRSLTLTSEDGFKYNDYCALSDDGLLALPHLQELRLVGFRVPGGERTGLATTSLRTLIMARASCDGIDAAGVNRQPRLRSLQLVDTSMPGSAWAQLNFSRSPKLRGLVLTDLYSEESRPALPAGVTSLSGLRRLHLVNCSLGELPPGPYLSSLTELALTKNRVGSLPAHLKEATALQRLCLGDNYALDLWATPALSILRHLMKHSLRDLHYQSIQFPGPDGYQDDPVHEAHSVDEYERFLRNAHILAAWTKHDLPDLKTHEHSNLAAYEFLDFVPWPKQ